MELETLEIPCAKTRSPSSTALQRTTKPSFTLEVLGWTWCRELPGSRIPPRNRLHRLKHHLGVMGTFILSNPFIRTAILKRAINAAVPRSRVAQPDPGQGQGGFDLQLCAVASWCPGLGTELPGAPSLPRAGTLRTWELLGAPISPEPRSFIRACSECWEGHGYNCSVRIQRCSGGRDGVPTPGVHQLCLLPRHLPHTPARSPAATGQGLGLARADHHLHHSFLPRWMLSCLCATALRGYSCPHPRGETEARRGLWLVPALAARAGLSPDSPGGR